MSKTKNAIIYVLIAFGTLGNVVCFGIYLSILIEAEKDSSTCSFTYNNTNLLILVVISGVWLLSFLMAQFFVLKTKSHYHEDKVK